MWVATTSAPESNLAHHIQNSDSAGTGTSADFAGMFRADSWNATYHWVPGNGAFGSLDVGGDPEGPLTEDPVLYRGRRGFHIIFHSHPDLTHAWSADGLTWHWSPQVSGPPNHLAQGGGDNERPRVLLTGEGDLDWLFVGQLLSVKGAGGGQDAARLAAFKAI